MAKKKKTGKNRPVNNKSNASNNDSNERRMRAKKAAIVGDNSKDKKSSAYTIAIVAIMIASSIAIFINMDSDIQNYNTDKSVTNPVEENNLTQTTKSEVTFNPAMFSDGMAKHFQFKNGNILIKYYIIKSSDGVVRAAFDACDVCWRARKGYYQDGDDMVCRNCGRRFASKLVNVVQGGCNPAPLNRQLVNGKLIIKIDDIIKGSQFFDFGRRS